MMIDEQCIQTIEILVETLGDQPKVSFINRQALEEDIVAEQARASEWCLAVCSVGRSTERDPRGTWRPSDWGGEEFLYLSETL